MNERDTLLRRLSAAQFAAWELHVYLDTHPNDAQAIAKYEQYELKVKELTMDYESKYGALTINSGAGAVEWLDNPWPWDYSKEDDN